MSEKLKPCPKCGSKKIRGRVCGGIAAFGCGEFEYEVVCECGITFDTMTFDTAKEAEEQGIAEWNTRAERTAHLIKDDHGFIACSECMNNDDIVQTSMYCPDCGARMIRHGITDIKM